MTPIQIITASLAISVTVFLMLHQKPEFHHSEGETFRGGSGDGGDFVPQFDPETEALILQDLAEELRITLDKLAEPLE